MLFPKRSNVLAGLAALLLLLLAACTSNSAAPAAMPPASAVPSSVPAAPGTSSPTPIQSTAAVVPVTGNQPTVAAPADAQAMLQAAIEHYQAVGRDQALQDFTNQVPPFNSDSLFMLCIDASHNITALGGQPLYVGLSADKLSDSTGGYFGQLLWLAATAEPKGSLPFQWTDPNTNQPASKILVYQKLSQDVCGVVANQP